MAAPRPTGGLPSSPTDPMGCSAPRLNMLAAPLPWQSVECRVLMRVEIVLCELVILCELQSYRTTREMAAEFVLQILRRRGPNAFQSFLKCLVRADEGMHFIATQLDATAVARYANA